MMEVEGAFELAAEMQLAGAQALPVLREVMHGAAINLQDLWRANARKTAGKHGRFYPSSITMDSIPEFGAATYEVGPDKAKKQGSMGRGFEYGSVNQPPHLDGQKAAEVVERQIEATIELAVQGLL